MAPAVSPLSSASRDGVMSGSDATRFRQRRSLGLSRSCAATASCAAIAWSMSRRIGSGGLRLDIVSGSFSMPIV